ncbi:hypothetical protein AGMMS50284_6110 [Clostridia bacterium]|nr:hypothetical protein AGMMS50284_6110 [Clostridia bacterium]
MYKKTKILLPIIILGMLFIVGCNKSNTQTAEPTDAPLKYYDKADAVLSLIAADTEESTIPLEITSTSNQDTAECETYNFDNGQLSDPKKAIKGTMNLDKTNGKLKALSVLGFVNSKKDVFKIVSNTFLNNDLGLEGFPEDKNAEQQIKTAYKTKVTAFVAELEAVPDGDTYSNKVDNCKIYYVHDGGIISMTFSVV